jgi:hypothetical protein
MKETLPNHQNGPQARSKENLWGYFGTESLKWRMKGHNATRVDHLHPITAEKFDSFF